MTNRREFMRNMGVLIGGLALSSLNGMAENLCRLSLTAEEKKIWMDILEYARWSPSPHNLQPWKMKIISATEVEVYYDPKRLLPEEDPDTRFLIIGMAIFLEYMSVAAAHHQLQITTEYKKEKLNAKANGPQFFARVRLSESKEIAEWDRELILQRRTSRLPYNDEPVADDIMNKLTTITKEHGHRMGYSHDQEMADWTIAINEYTVFSDLGKDNIRKEIKSWLRYDKSEAESKKDGLWSKCMRFPGWFMRSFFEEHEKYSTGKRRERLGKHYRKKMRGSRTIAWLSGPFETFDDWVNCGTYLAKIWLEMTRNDIYMHPFGSVITNEGAHAQLVEKLQFDESENKLWLLFRLGNSKEPPRSCRLDLNDLLI